MAETNSLHALYPEALGSQLPSARAAGRSRTGSPEGCAMSNDRADAILSAVLIIGVPTVFWLAIIEIATAVAGVSYGVTGRIVFGGLMIAFLAVIRGCARSVDR